MRGVGRFEVRGDEALDEHLGDFDSAMFRGLVPPTEDEPSIGLVFELSLEDDDENEAETDDLSLPLWLVPALDRYQCVTFRAPGGGFEEDFTGIFDEDRKEMPEQGWLVDQIATGFEDDGEPIVIRFRMRASGAPELVLTAALGGPLVVVVDAVASRPAELSVDVDAVTLGFAMPFEGPATPDGVTLTQVSELRYEARRVGATPAAFVGYLQALAELPTFRDAMSGGEGFDAETFRAYVTPGVRPWS